MMVTAGGVSNIAKSVCRKKGLCLVALKLRLQHRRRLYHGCALVSEVLKYCSKFHPKANEPSCVSQVWHALDESETIGSEQRAAAR